MYDLLIIGGGPAGVSAALTAANRQRSALVLSNDYHANLLCRAPEVTNYPGMPGVTGQRLMDALYDHLKRAGVAFTAQKVVQVMNMGGRFTCGTASEVFEGRSLLLCLGQVPATALEGEREYLGRGVSYCATCDGMLYRGRTVAVLGSSPDAPEEANFLASIGCKITYFSRAARPESLREEIAFQRASKYSILGDGTRVTHLSADGQLFPADGVFVLRAGVSADSLIPGIAMKNGHIEVDSAMCTSIPGVFAAGDCTGKPYQIAKATGQGNIAALEADRWLDSRKERNE